MVAGLQLFAAAAAHAVPGWHLRNSHSQGPADVYFTYGYSGDFQHAGDWNGDGRDTPASYRQNERKWYLRDSNSCCVADTAFTYGNGDPGSYTVMGDWNGDGIDTPGIVRNENGTMHWYLRNSNTEGVSDVDLYYGYHGDQYYVAGDWNGDGIDTPGIVKRDFNCWCFQWHLKNSHFGGWADVIFTWAGPVSGDTTTPIVGDWNGDNIDTPGIHRSGAYKFSLRNANSDGWSDIVYTYGQVGDKPLVGDWNGDGVDTVAVIRESDPQYPTTTRYGGGDGAVTAPEEIEAVRSAFASAASDADARGVMDGLHPNDRPGVESAIRATIVNEDLLRDVYTGRIDYYVNGGVNWLTSMEVAWEAGYNAATAKRVTPAVVAPFQRGEDVTTQSLAGVASNTDPDEADAAGSSWQHTDSDGFSFLSADAWARAEGTVKWYHGKAPRGYRHRGQLARGSRIYDRYDEVHCIWGKVKWGYPTGSVSFPPGASISGADESQGYFVNCDPTILRDPDPLNLAGLAYAKAFLNSATVTVCTSQSKAEGPRNCGSKKMYYRSGY